MRMKKVFLNTQLLTSLSSVLDMQPAKMIAATGIVPPTWYYIMQHIDGITVQQLLSIANGLKIPVRRFFYADKAVVSAKREDYIVTPYTPCYYDAAAMQHIVDTRNDATWQKGAKATGMTYDNLKKSTLGIRRLPVQRFLAVCSAFDIDPFTILIDPNHEPRKSRRTAPGSYLDRDKEMSSIRADIASLHDEIRTLNETIDDLKEKYETLLKAHDALAKSVNINNVNIDTVSGQFIGISQDP